VAETRTLEREVSTAEIAGRPQRGAAELPEEQIRRDLATQEAATEHPTPLFLHEEAEDFRRRWMAVQTDFVDDPRASVQAADSLVAQTMKRLAEVFADERARLEGQWSKGGEVGTEDLRQALRRYRSFFDRLLAV
jgi:hypothetical protein